MHEQATTLKHYLKVVPQRRITVSGQARREVPPSPSPLQFFLSHPLVLAHTSLNVCTWASLHGATPASR